MLRITTSETEGFIRLRLEGRLAGAWVAELEALYSSKKKESGNRPLILDLENLTSSDAAGRYLLTLIRRDGTTLENVNPLSAPLLWQESE